MGKAPEKRLLDTSALVIGYAMSRLDREYLRARGCRSWTAAFTEAAERLDVAPASIKNLRDEFDPQHGNRRRGWAGRDMRPNRKRVMGALCDVTDAALIEIANRVLALDPDAVTQVVRPLTQPDRRFQNVAERLRTGRLAEEHFLECSHQIVDVAPSLILDHRTLARGYDFGIERRERIAIEVKGLKQRRGGIMFTDREWSEALERRSDYWLVVVGNLSTEPIARVIPDPSQVLDANLRLRQAITPSWHANVGVA